MREEILIGERAKWSEGAVEADRGGGIKRGWTGVSIYTGSESCDSYLDVTLNDCRHRLHIPNLKIEI